MRWLTPAACLGDDASPNIPRIIAFSFLSLTANSIYSSSVWTPFVYQVFDESNVMVGWIGAVSGFGELLAAIVAGLLADKLDRQMVLYAAGCIGMVATALMAVAVYLEHTVLLFVATTIIGAYGGLYFPPSEALFADSVATGSRTMVYNIKYMFESWSAIVGYLVAFTMFSVLGNHWERPVMKRVIFAGLGLQMVSILVIFSVKRKYTLKGMGREDDAASEESDSAPKAVEPSGSSATTTEASPLIVNDDATAPATSRRCDEDGRLCKYALKQRHLPYLIATEESIVCLGSGMTVMFFSLFMINDYGISPARLALINAISAVVTGLWSVLNGAIGDRIGRIRTIIMPRIIGPLMLLYLIVAQGQWCGHYLIDAVYILRYAAMNCYGGLARAVIMDLICQKSRGRWNAVESLQSASWAGSAILGGFLAQKYGYSKNFLITCALQLLSVFILMGGFFTDDNPTPELKAKLAATADDDENDDGDNDYDSPSKSARLAAP